MACQWLFAMQQKEVGSIVVIIYAFVFAAIFDMA